MNKQIVFESSKISEGNMSYLYGDKNRVNNNRQIFLKKLNISPTLCSLMDVSSHGDDILTVYSGDVGMGMEDDNPAPVVDALICLTPNLAIGLLTADCFPVVVVDRDKTIIGLAHLGWQGVDIELLPKLIKEMSNISGILPSNFDIRIGPGASAKSYIAKNPSQLNDSRWKNHIKKLDDDSYQIDLQSFIIEQAIKAGVKNKSIKRNEIDTITDKNYFSHKRSVNKAEPEGRMLTVATLKT